MRLSSDLPPAGFTRAEPRPPARPRRAFAVAAAVLGAGLALTSASLWLLDTLADGASHLVEVGVLTAANLAVTVMRFVAMRTWIFRGARPG